MKLIKIFILILFCILSSIFWFSISDDLENNYVNKTKYETWDQIPFISRLCFKIFIYFPYAVFAVGITIKIKDNLCQDINH